METSLRRESQLFLQWDRFFMKGSAFNGKVGIFTSKSGSFKPIIVMGRKRHRNGSSRLVRFVIESIPIVASKLKILPQPLDTMLEELTGGGNGNGRGWGFKRSFGGKGWFDGSRRKVGFCWFLLVFGLGLVMGRQIGHESVYWIFGFGLIFFALVEMFSRKATRNVILGGLCCFGVLAVFGFRAEMMRHWVRDFRVGSPLVKRGGGRRKSRFN